VGRSPMKANWGVSPDILPGEGRENFIGRLSLGVEDQKVRGFGGQSSKGKEKRESKSG